MHLKSVCIAPLSLLLCISLAGPLQAQIVDRVQLVSVPYLTIPGELGTPGDQAGRSVAWVGDVNQDGVTDVVVGASAHRAAGSVTLYSGKDGVPLWRVRGLFQDDLGRSVAGAGDVNRDGYPDVIAGAPGISPQSGGAGSALVFSGKDGAVLWRFDGTRGWSAPFQGDVFGSSVAGPGDVNQDGYADLLVGALYAGPGGRGFVYLFSGKDGKKIWETGSAQDLILGRSVEGAGDVNLDGVPDLLVGESPLSSRGVASASVYSGRDFSLLLKLKFLPEERLISGRRSLAGIGDVNLDGIPDVIAGTNRLEYPFTTSHVVVFSGENGEALLRLDGLASYRLYGVAGAGDMDLDGVPDLLVSARLRQDNKTWPAVVFVFSGRTGAEILQVRSTYENDLFGSDLAGGGDVDGDPFPDFLVGNPGPYPYTGPGHAFVYVTDVALVRYGTGVPGSWNYEPTIGTGGEIPRLGNSSFRIQVSGMAGGVPVMIAGSTARATTSLLGLTLYGDFLTPGAFWTSIFLADGPLGFPGFGLARVTVPIPQDATLLGLQTYWQGFVFDPGSPLPIGVSHTKGLEVRVVR